MCRWLLGIELIKTRQASKRIVNQILFCLLCYVPLSNWVYPLTRVQEGDLYNDVSATRAVIGRCPWSIRVQDTWMTSQEICFLGFVQHGARFWKVFVRLFRIKQVKASKKSLAGAIYKEEKWWDGGKRVLHYFRMPKPQEIFTTVAIVCHRHEGLSDLQNVFAMFWAKEDFEKLFEETVCN